MLLDGPRRGGNPNNLGWSRVTGRRSVPRMTTLRIEHPISDLDIWLEAFQRFAPMRRDAGVRSQRIHHPVGDNRFIAVDLDFDTIDAASAFREFLMAVVWATPENAPALAGVPKTTLLEQLANASSERA